MGAEVIVTWGTWEELLLGGAVIRHGTGDWSVVAAELRGRTHSPSAITPEVCKAKYEELQQRYSGCTAWYEELKKRRVAELKRALEKSEDSIGSLESKLESLKADKNEKRDDCHVDNNSFGPELDVPSQKLERVESSSKELSKDGLSAGSFTHQTDTNWSHECQVPAMSSEDMEISAGVSGSIEHEKVLNIDKLTDTAGKRDDCHVDNESVGPESHVPSQKLERVESSTKETSKDGLSAGSFTHQTQTNWSHECQIPAMSSEDMEITPGVSGSTEHEKVLNVDKLTETVYEGQGGCFKKRRGKRKRKDCARNINEASVRESDFSIVVSRLKESSTSNCGEVVKSSGVTEENTNLKKDGTKDLMAILDSILEIKGASCFCRKHDSQKRQRYKQLIQRHMDFDTIRSRISNKTIDSVVQLFRDMFLLTTNALMFYSKNTRQYKSALLMRDIVKEKLTENRRNVIHSNVDTVCATPSLKVPSVRPCNQKINAAKAADGSDPASGVSNKAKKPRTGSSKENSLSSVKTLHIKKAVGGSKKHEPSTPNLMKEMKEKKRRRTRL